MKNIVKLIFIAVFLENIAYATPLNTGEKVFRAYCWGCHHQTAVAFGPPFQEIANKRSLGQIEGHIVSPKSDYKLLGYKRSVMPAFGDTLSQKELDLIAQYILSYKDKK